MRRRDGAWKRSAITRTSHPFNACHLERGQDGSFHATLVTGAGEAVSKDEMDRYGWGERVERWTSGPDGERWTRRSDLTPRQGHRYQNVTFVARADGGMADGMILFYGWRDRGDTGTAYLWRQEQAQK